jgi:hypothetical protein
MMSEIVATSCIDARDIEQKGTQKRAK